MTNKAVVSLTTGLEDAEKVTVAFLVAVGAAEQQRQTLMFLTKEAVRLALDGTIQGGTYMVCPICFEAKHLDKDALVSNAELAGTVPMWKWIGDEGAVTFSY
ncbi:peroxiredoxin [Rhodococcus koreensis]|uniref:peroxiredoxin n=1 Tax=Rhodococcus koreensis TaxID=99653 RepID=UPI0036DB1704